jgi:hypothetical protein
MRERWREGATLHQIAHMLGRMHSWVHRILAETGGIRPPTRTACCGPCAPQIFHPARPRGSYGLTANRCGTMSAWSTCAPQKCRPAVATPDFSTSAASGIRFSGPYSRGTAGVA